MLKKRKLNYFEREMAITYDRKTVNGSIKTPVTNHILNTTIQTKQPLRGLIEAISSSVKSYPLLESRIITEKNRPYFIPIRGAYRLPITVIFVQDNDIDQLGVETTHVEIEERTFNKEEGPLWHLTVLVSPEVAKGTSRRYLLIFSFLHAISDQYSIAIFLKEILERWDRFDASALSDKDEENLKRELTEKLIAVDANLAFPPSITKFIRPSPLAYLRFYLNYRKVMNKLKHLKDQIALLPHRTTIKRDARRYTKAIFRSIDIDVTERLLQQCREHDATFNGLVTAIVWKHLPSLLFPHEKECVSEFSIVDALSFDLRHQIRNRHFSKNSFQMTTMVSWDLHTFQQNDPLFSSTGYEEQLWKYAQAQSQQVKTMRSKKTDMAGAKVIDFFGSLFMKDTFFSKEETQGRMSTTYVANFGNFFSGIQLKNTSIVTLHSGGTVHTQGATISIGIGTLNDKTCMSVLYAEPIFEAPEAENFVDCVIRTMISISTET